MIQKIDKGIVFWQQVKDGVGEPAIILKKYVEVFSIQQEKKEILINNEVVEEFVKVIRQSISLEKKTK